MKKVVKIILTVFLTMVVVTISAAFFMADFFNHEEVVDLSSYNEQQDIISLHNLNIDAKVNDDNSVNVAESFDVTFNRYGLTEVVRLIPYATKTVRFDEKGNKKEDLLYAKITEISGEGDENAVLSIIPDEVEGYLTIGLKVNSAVPVGETRSYRINYTYNMGKDKNKGFDDIYFNLVGVNSLLTIRDVSFKVTLPDISDDVKNITLYKGKFGENETLIFNFNNNIITGSCDVLTPLEGITLRAIYEDGVLKHKTVIPTQGIIAIIIGVIALVLGIILFVFYRQVKKPVEPVELIVPEGLTPLMAEYYNSYNCTIKGIIGSLVVLANKGYMKINERKDQEIEFIKNKEILDTENYSLKALYRALFTGRDKVLISELEHDVGFANTQNAIATVSKAKGENSLYDKKSKKKMLTIKTIYSILLFVTGVLFATAPISYFGFVSTVLSFKVLMILALMFVMLIMMFSTKKNYIPVIIITEVMIFGLLWCYLKNGYNIFDNCYLIFIALILMVISLLFMSGESKYSKGGAIKKGRALGFKTFIEKCEVEQIKAFAQENPSYYFDVLPFAYVYGLSDVWIKKFECLEVQPPEWVTCEDSTLISVIRVNSIFSRMSEKTKVVNQKIIARQSMSSGSSGSHGGSFGGGSFGGGFSGGGGGGGGFGAR